MWKPPEKIKFAPPQENWPSQSQAEQSLWFSPLELGPICLKQRTWVPAMVPWRATDAGEVSQDVIDWYASFARGRPGGLVVEATGIRDIPSGPLLRIGHDRYIPGLRRLVDAVQEASNGQTKLLIQLIDFLAIRRRVAMDQYLQRFLTITDSHRKQLNGNDWDEQKVRSHLIGLPAEELRPILTVREWETATQGYRERVTDTDNPAIRDLPSQLPGLFASAAQRALNAGFDGVELHYAHAYTMASFLSALNTRTDGYGGPREQRVRLPLEVFAAVKHAVGSEIAVGCRFLSDDCIAGGSNVDDTSYFAIEFARAGMDFLSLSRGGKFEDAKQPGVGSAAYPYTGPSGYECMPGHLSDQQGPFGRNIEPTARIREAVRGAGFTTPIVACGGIHSFRQAETALAEGKADIVGAARQSLADPTWFAKVHRGDGSSVKRCEYTNYCEGLDQKHKQVTCQLWDRQQLDEPDVTRSKDNKRRLTAPKAW